MGRWKGEKGEKVRKLVYSPLAGDRVGPGSLIWAVRVWAFPSGAVMVMDRR